MTIKAGDLYIMQGTTSAYKIRNLEMLNKIFPELQITIKSDPDSNIELDWLFHRFICPDAEDIINNKNFNFAKNSQFPFHKYFIAKVNSILPLPVLPEDQNLGKPVPGFGRTDKLEDFVTFSEIEFGVEPLKELTIPIEKFNPFTARKTDRFSKKEILNLYKIKEHLKNIGLSIFQSFSKSKTIKKSSLYYFTKNDTDTHFNMTKAIIGSDIKVQTPLVEAKGQRNSYLAFANIFMDASPNDILFLNHSVAHPKKKDIDIPVIADELISDMFNHFSINKNITVILSSGNSNALKGFDINVFFSNGFISEAIMVGALAKSTTGALEFESNFSDSFIDLYVETTSLGLSASSGASAFIAKKVKEIQDGSNGKFLLAKDIKALLKAKATEKTIDGKKVMCILNPLF